MGSFVSIRSTELDELLACAQQEQSDDTPEMNEIIRRFERMAMKAAYYLTTDEMLRDDLVNAGREAIVTAVRRFNPERGAFPPFAQLYVKGAERKELKLWTRTKPTGPELSEVEDSALYAAVLGAPATADTTWGSEKTANAVASLKPKQQQLLEARYIEDATLVSIAADEGVTEAAISQRLKTALTAVASSLAA